MAAAGGDDARGAGDDTSGHDASGHDATRAAIEAVWRLESTRMNAGLVRIVRDVALAEDLAQDAIVAARVASTPAWASAPASA